MQWTRHRIQLYMYCFVSCRRQDVIKLISTSLITHYSFKPFFRVSHTHTHTHRISHNIILLNWARSIYGMELESATILDFPARRYCVCGSSSDTMLSFATASPVISFWSACRHFANLDAKPRCSIIFHFTRGGCFGIFTFSKIVEEVWLWICELLVGAAKGAILLVYMTAQLHSLHLMPFDAEKWLKLAFKLFKFSNTY